MIMFVGVTVYILVGLVSSRYLVSLIIKDINRGNLALIDGFDMTMGFIYTLIMTAMAPITAVIALGLALHGTLSKHVGGKFRKAFMWWWETDRQKRKEIFK